MAEQLLTSLVDAVNKGDYDAVAGLISDTVTHNLSRSGISVDCSSSQMAQFIARAGKANLQLLDTFASGDRICGRYTATVSGDDVPGASPGSSAQVTGIVIGRVENGKIAEMWAEQDTVGLLLALGVPVGN